LPSASGYTFQWQDSTSAGWQNIAGATGINYSYTVTGPRTIRVIVTCTNSSQTTTTNSVQINATGPTYATIPFFHDFETWGNYCATNDVPTGSNWTNTPPTGDQSWRRDDQGASANWTNATLGTYSPAAKSGSRSARFHTYTNSPNAQQGNLDLYLNASGTTGSKQLYFHTINTGLYGALYDSLAVFLSTNGGTSFTQIYTADTSIAWKRHTVAINSNSANTIIRFQGKKNGGWYEYSDIGLDSVYVAPPCTGTPTAGAISPGSGNGCPGVGQLLTLNGAPLAGNLNYQWQVSTTSATAGFTNAPGASNALTYTTPALTDTVWYRVVVTCQGSGQSATTAVVQYNVGQIPYAAIPYTEDFESWSTRCSPTDIPSASWTNIPSTGDLSWRREDQGASANWQYPTSGQWWPGSPIAASQSHAARFHNYYASPNGARGRMDLHVNCATITGNKELQFFVNMNGNYSYALDTLNVLYSTDGGATFTPLGAIQTTNGWELKTYVLPSNSATTVIRFSGRAYTYYNDIGLDLVRVLPPCTGAPVAGTVNPANPCANTNFQLSLNGASQAAGLTYQWQQSNSPNGPWVTVPGSTSSQFAETSIQQATYFRAIVTCAASGQSATTPAQLVNLAPFYFCYCQSAALYTGFGGNIGNVTIRRRPNNVVLLNNGVATPLTNNANANNVYTSFTNLAPTPLYRDSLYEGRVSAFFPTAAYDGLIGIYIDYNRDGIYQASERVVYRTVNNTGTPTYSGADTFRIPTNTGIGITGMRAIYVYGTFSVMNPCGTYSYGETEDYLVDLSYAPCTGPANAGIAEISDTSICAGYTLTLTDTTHERLRSGLIWSWQRSTNAGASWTNLPNSTGKDTLQPVITQASRFRLRMICTITGDTTYSNEVSVSIQLPYQCYCYSIANGGSTGLTDSTDVGAFKIGQFVMNTGGPHLLNPVAIRKRTDYTNVAQIELKADSTYAINVFHTMRAAQHQNAKITLFIDYNNNNQYDAPGERVLSGLSTANNWFYIGSITIPPASGFVADMPTGMRLIINENTNPNIPSDEACGVYESGETEDYVVVLRNQFSASVAAADFARDLGLYPNPTTGKAEVVFTITKPVSELQLVVTDLTGRAISSRTFANPGREFRSQIDLTGQARGVYFVEVRADGQKLIKKLVVQ